VISRVARLGQAALLGALYDVHILLDLVFYGFGDLVEDRSNSLCVDIWGFAGLRLPLIRGLSFSREYRLLEQLLHRHAVPLCDLRQRGHVCMALGAL
jgi:hypothetical protein